METLSPSTTTPEVITDGQIAKTGEILTATLRKARENFRSADVQITLERCGSTLQERFLKLFEELITTTTNIIIRTIKVIRTRSPKGMLEATKRVQYTTNSVVKIIPRGEDEDVTVEFFKLGKYVSDNDLALEYQKRDLTPDPYAQAAVNEADPAFADEHPNSTHWKDEDGNWCYIAFHRHDDERHVDVHRNNDGWDDDWWFAGVRKSRSLEN
jgi:hypothetical protein